jgi:hypothetical protein
MGLTCIKEGGAKKKCVSNLGEGNILKIFHLLRQRSNSTNVKMDLTEVSCKKGT